VDGAGRTGLELALGVLGECNEDALLSRVLGAACELTGAAYGALGVLTQQQRPGLDETRFARFVTVGVDQATRASLSLPRGLGVLGELIREPAPLRLSDVGAHPRSYGFPPGHPPMRTFLGVPVFVDGRAFANLYLAEKAGGAEFTDQDEQALVALARLAGTAIEHAQRYTYAQQHHQELEQTVAALEATTNILHAVGTETDLDAVLALVAKRGRALVHARALVIELLQGGELLIAAAAGETPEGVVGRRIPMSGSFAEQAIGTLSAVRVEDEASRARFNEVAIGGLEFWAEAALVVPLVFHGRANGALLAIDRRVDGPAFSAEDARLLDAFAVSAATAVAGAQSVEADIERLASIVRSSTDAIVTTDPHGIITSWNPGAEQLLGYSAHEVLDQHAQDIAKLVVPQDIPADVEIWRRVLAGESVKHQETTRIRKDGTQVEVSLSAFTIRDRYGAITGLASISRDMTEHKQMQRILSQRLAELERAREDTLRRLALAAEYRDDDTLQHTERVGTLAASIATIMGLDEATIDLIKLAAPLHDIGKLGISDTILQKPGKLTPQERDTMQQHTLIGAAILAGSEHPVLQMAEQIAIAHHERWDGTGYPYGLAGEAIPLPARIVSVADTFDALTHQRPYKHAWPTAQAIREISQQAGTQFDPKVVDAFTKIEPERLANRHLTPRETEQTAPTTVS